MSSPLSPLLSPLSPIAGAHGALQLLTETDPASEMIRRAVRLEAAPDGRSVLLVDTDARRPGLQREMRYEITQGELIAVIRAQGADVS
jgi:Mrp family chromosome partitioning ATPase